MSHGKGRVAAIPMQATNREGLLTAIVGSVNQTTDYDRAFRPLNPALKERWIDVHVLSERRGWEPIIVHKIGELYFVEDGHHRVSVARYSGWDSIEARVYESQLDRDESR